MVSTWVWVCILIGIIWSASVAMDLLLIGIVLWIIGKSPIYGWNTDTAVTTIQWIWKYVTVNKWPGMLA